ncbi:hypothetical protein NDU88_004812 [Pleurodeles waltl]|uniref:Uncharacterized protein n=1 Tax=Pleurodeles waltl TaxID=8319 RepID=A0AAV7M8S5_PLEWA|nr:hypothetical protein NDU88_004812 [Pleurodeles waltl]
MREKKMTSGAEKEAVTDPQTAREQEDIGTTSGNPREVKTRRQYPKTLAMLWEERGLCRSQAGVGALLGAKSLLWQMVYGTITDCLLH